MILRLESISKLTLYHKRLSPLLKIITDDDVLLTIRTKTQHHRMELVDRIIGNVGYRPDDRLFQELHIHQCYATSGPMKLATALMGDSTQDCLQQTTTGPETLLTPEPNFYILGSKSYGRNPHFLFARGLDQIQQLFTIIGQRDDLNLYDSVRKLAMQDLDN